MQEFGEKVVLHIPLSKYVDGILEDLDIDGIIGELIDELDTDSHYRTMVESHYKGRIYNELLIVIFSNDSSGIIRIFRDWILRNDDILKQEAYAFELDNRLIILSSDEDFQVR